MKRFLISVALIALAGSALAQDSVTMVNPDALAWKDNPNIPKGGQVAVLVGDPTKAGSVVVQRVKLPANYKVPPHTHPYAETVTVISGSVGLGMGEKFDATKGEMAKAGALFANPQETRGRSSKFSSSAREASTTSTRLTIRARSRTRKWRGRGPAPKSDTIRSGSRHSRLSPKLSAASL